MGVYGMTYEQFWHGDPWLAKAYREAYVERRKAENNRDWFSGRYFFDALSISLSNAFRKQGTPAKDYLEEPYQLFELNEDERAIAEAKMREKTEEVYRQMIARQKAEKAAKAAKEQEQQNAET